MTGSNLDSIGFYTLTNERAKNVSMNSQMKRGEIIINEYCNFKCPYCRGLDQNIFSDRKRKELTYEEICNIIDIWCKDTPIKNIRFSGGEPTYHKDIIDIVKYAKKRGVQRIAISTNGSNKTQLYQDLIDFGVNDFSISLDASNSTIGDKMAGDIEGSWDKVIHNIRHVSEQVYVTCGVVLEPDNIGNFIDVVNFASTLGVADIRVIPSAQWNKPLVELNNITKEMLDKHKILKYRVSNFITGKHIRGIRETDANKCPLVLDDSAIAGQYHYPCVIYMREQGKPIGKINESMREERLEWFKRHDSHNDQICKKNCLDACIDHNNFIMQTNKTVLSYLEDK